jgi:beta-lactamase superfamily II metal-dependent hydrolase
MRNKLLAPTIAVMMAFFVARDATNAQDRTTLEIYVVDVEGGNATLFVSPSGQSVLIDTGNIGAEASVRDAERIVAAVKDARLTQIDHLITTHWHGDHFGGMAELAKRIPIKHYIDHGPTMQPQPASVEFLEKVYPTLYGATKRTIVKPGDAIAVAGLDWHIVTSNGEAIEQPLPGAGAANPYCASFKPQEPDTTENARSIGSIVTFGRFRVMHLGDLSWNKEFDLMCPTNRIGVIDLFVVSHHGESNSNSEVLVHATKPRVAVMNNGTRKGGTPDEMKVIYSSPGLENLWQMHFSLLSGQEYAVPGMFIANLTDEPAANVPVVPMARPPGPGTSPGHVGQAYWIKISAKPDGSFTVTNARTQFSKTYAVTAR